MTGAVRRTAHRANAATGGRLGRAIRATSRRADAASNGRAGRAVEAMRRHPVTARALALLGVVTLAFVTLPMWALGLLSALGGAAIGLSHGLRRQSARRTSAQPPEGADETTGSDETANSAATGPDRPNPTGDRVGAASATAARPTQTFQAAQDHRTSRRTAMDTTFPLAVIAAEMQAAAAAHAPVDMFTVARELDQLPEIPAGVSASIRTYTTRLQAEYPIADEVVEAIFTFFDGMAQLISAAGEIGPLFRELHEADLRREEAPRTGEDKWNV